MLDYLYFFTDELQNPWQMLVEPRLKITAIKKTWKKIYIVTLVVALNYKCDSDNTSLGL